MAKNYRNRNGTRTYESRYPNGTRYRENLDTEENRTFTSYDPKTGTRQGGEIDFARAMGSDTVNNAYKYRSQRVGWTEDGYDSRGYSGTVSGRKTSGDVKAQLKRIMDRAKADPSVYERYGNLIRNANKTAQAHADFHTLGAVSG